MALLIIGRKESITQCIAAFVMMIHLLIWPNQTPSKWYQ